MLKRKFFRTARRYKAQFISMVLMIAIGSGVFLGFNIEWKSIEVDTDGFFERSNYADFRLYSDNGFSEEDIDAVKKISGVDAATRYLSVNADVGGVDTGKKVALTVSEDYTVSTMVITDGAEYDKNSDGIWLSKKFAQENGYEIGDNIKFTYNTKTVEGKIVGLCRTGEQLICVQDSNQLMPDYESYGYAYITPKKLKSALGAEFYSQINIISDKTKEDMEQEVSDALGRAVMVSPKDDHTAYAGASGEIEEGESMGTILPVIFLAVGILTMVTTMHRISVNEKTQIGTLKALGFRDSRILAHYTSYGLFVGLLGTALAIGLGYAIAAIVISENGMMGTYFDIDDWSLHMPSFCVPIIILTIVFLTLISYLSVKRMLKGTAAETLREYEPKNMRRTTIEKTRAWDKLSFGTKWNLRDLLRHKSRSAMTLFGIISCMVLLVGGFGMKDTADGFFGLLGDDVNNYATKVNLSQTASNDSARELARKLDGDWCSSSGISYEGKTVTLEIYSVENNKVQFLAENNDITELGDDGVYLCLRLEDTAKIGDTIEFSPYGSDKTYSARVAGYYRSLMTENIVMTDAYADEIGIDYRITNIYTDVAAGDIEESDNIADKQSKQAIMDTYDSFMEIMDIMVIVLAVGAVLLGSVVLYNLGIMSYIERSRELATLKVLGFRDKKIGRLLISQNIWLTTVGVVIGFFAGIGVLQALIIVLASEYEYKIMLGPLTIIFSIVLTFAVSLAVSAAVARKNKKIDMVEALKNGE